MERYKLNDFTGGWVVGDFSPVLFSNKSVEIAVKTYKAGDTEDCHFQRIACEATIVTEGKISMGESIFDKGEIVLIPPNECSPFTALEDSVLVCIKWPSSPEDKVICGTHS